MAKLVLAMDRHSSQMLPDQLGNYCLSGVDVLKFTPAALFDNILPMVKIMNPKVEIFMDMKIADISFGDNEGTNYKIARAVALSGIADYIDVHGFLGQDAIKECMEAGLQGKKPLKVLVLAGMTDPNYGKFFQKYNTKLFCQWAEDEAADGVILPANYLDLIRSVRNDFPDMPIWSPGFGRQNNPYKTIYEQIVDWRKVVGDNPENAAIIGTYLLDHPHIKEEVRNIKERLG